MLFSRCSANGKQQGAMVSFTIKREENVKLCLAYMHGLCLHKDLFELTAALT